MTLGIVATKVWAAGIIFFFSTIFPFDSIPNESYRLYNERFFFRSERKRFRVGSDHFSFRSNGNDFSGLQKD